MQATASVFPGTAVSASGRASAESLICGVRSLMSAAHHFIRRHICALIAVFTAISFVAFVAGRPVTGSMAAALTLLLGELPLVSSTARKGGEA